MPRYGTRLTPPRRRLLAYLYGRQVEGTLGLESYGTLGKALGYTRQCAFLYTKWLVAEGYLENVETKKLTDRGVRVLNQGASSEKSVD